MADEKAPDETPEDTDAAAAGPVAEGDSSSSRDDASGEESPSTPPAEETPETPAETEEVESAEQPAAEAEEAGPADQPAAEAEEPEAATGAPEAEEAEAAEEPEPAAEKPAAKEKPKEKDKDVIPGADLEPIAVETETRELSAEERARLEAEEEERARREAALVDAEETDAAPATRAPAKMESGARYLATGKRKSSIARVTLTPGDGKFEVNKRSLEEFFPRPLHQTMARQPLTVSGYEGNVDVRVRVHGGGISGQAGAVRHGIARALTEIDAELRGDLKRRGFLTRDARVKERRKAGLKKARKRPQFSKR
jgi:small subunit ribosomal protein S9